MLMHAHTQTHTRTLPPGWTLSARSMWEAPASGAVNAVEAAQGLEVERGRHIVAPHPPFPQDFVVGLSILLRGTVQEKLKWAFNLYDINKDGYITKEVRTVGVRLVSPCPTAAALAVLCPLPAQRKGPVGTAPRGSSLLGSLS